MAPDLARCYYVGDAAGRPKDFADSDRGFALAAGVAFYTPEAFFTTVASPGAGVPALGAGDGDGGACATSGGSGGASGGGDAATVDGGGGGDGIDDRADEFDRDGTP